MNKDEIATRIEVINLTLIPLVNSLPYLATTDWLKAAATEAKINKLDDEKLELSKLLKYLKEN
jgi:hypothetical protein